MKRAPTGKPIITACPACQELGGDATGRHLALWPSGAYSCIRYLKDAEHVRRIAQLKPELRLPEWVPGKRKP
jgi:hypothetical protein